jgi:uncharacterized ferritin-like protein (DUF455 family)
LTTVADSGIEECFFRALKYVGDERIEFIRFVNRFLIQKITDFSEDFNNRQFGYLDEPTGILATESLILIENVDSLISVADMKDLNHSALYIKDQNKRIEYDFDLCLPEIASFPEREVPTTYRSRSILDNDVDELLKTHLGRSKLLFFFLVDIELPAAEICALNIVQFRDYDLDLKIDMTRQVWDEVRHAQAVLERFNQIKVHDYSDYHFTGIVWQKWQMGYSLKEKLVIQQLIQEGNGLDAAEFLSQKFRKVGDERTAEILDFLTVDECRHVFFGNKWLKKLGVEKEHDLEQIIDKMSKAIYTPTPGSYPPNVNLRRLAGFSEHLLEWLTNRYSNKSVP